LTVTQSDVVPDFLEQTNLLLLRILRLIKEEVGCKLLVLVACEVGLDDKISLESETAKL